MPLHSPVEITVSTSIAPNAWRLEPWKNGRGTTAVVLRIPDDERYRVRISVAEVSESGPFSTFPGYTRWSLLLGGGPIWLGDHRLEGLYEIDGDVAIEARVEAPARLLNIVGKHLHVGVGEADADIVFDPETRVTRVLDERARVTGVWIRL
jgi:environmental stress-induced protein Ves